MRTNHIPAVDLSTAGHLPFAVQAVAPARTRAEQPDTDGAREHTEPEADLIKLLGAIPTAIDQAMKKTLPGEYAPEVAAQIAAGMIARIASPTPPLTAEQTTPVLDEGLGARITAPVETQLRDIDCNPDPDLVPGPFLGAQVVVSDYRSQAYGRRTRVWLHNGSVTGELTPAQARDALEAMRAFIPRLEAVIAVAEQEAAGDFDGDAEVERLDREAEGRRIAAITARAEGAR